MMIDDNKAISEINLLRIQFIQNKRNSRTCGLLTGLRTFWDTTTEQYIVVKLVAFTEIQQVQLSIPTTTRHNKAMMAHLVTYNRCAIYSYT